MEFVSSVGSTQEFSGLSENVSRVRTKPREPKLNLKTRAAINKKWLSNECRTGSSV